MSGFVERLVASPPYVDAVARYLRGRDGIYVHVPPIRIRPTRAQAGEYADDGDIWCWKPPRDCWTVDVTGRPGRIFHTLAEWTPPLVFIQEEQRAAKWKHAPRELYNVSGDLAFALKIDVEETRPHWRLVEKFDTLRQMHRKFWAMPKAAWTLVDLRV